MDNKIMWQLGHFKYPQVWSVYPMEDGRILVYGDKRGVGCFNYRTGKGKLTHTGKDYSDLANANLYTFPDDFIIACMGVCPSLGGQSEINGHVFNHTVSVLKNGSI